MSKFLIKGGSKLKGEVKLAGNKNSALNLIPATLLCNSASVLTNIPRIRDVAVMIQLLEQLGARVSGVGTDTLTIDPKSLDSYELDPELSTKIRASVILAAPLLCKFGKAVVVPPGGDQIGERLLDTHFIMMKEMGVEIERKNGKYYLEWRKRKPINLFLDEASVTATEMAMMLATSVKGETRIDNAATEPHVVDLADFLTKTGIHITGAGTNTIFIKGGSDPVGAEHKIVPDHIEGGTFIVAAAITGGDILINDIVPNHYKMILKYLSHMGVKTEFVGDNSLRVLPSKLVSTKKKFKAQLWPGFPTDLMSPFIILATQTQGTVLCHDWMYEWRMFFVDDLISMGANIFIADPHRVIISGPTKLLADVIYCKDIRAGMSVILAALVAEGESTIDNVEMVERGYENIEERLRLLGAEIKRVA